MQRSCRQIIAVYAWLLKASPAATRVPAKLPTTIPAIAPAEREVPPDAVLGATGMAGGGGGDGGWLFGASGFVMSGLLLMVASVRDGCTLGKPAVQNSNQVSISHAS